MSTEAYGTITLTDWISAPSGRLVKQVRGNFKRAHADTVFGFSTRGPNHANWLIIVTGDAECWHIPGCQIRAVVVHDACVPVGPEAYVVL